MHIITFSTSNLLDMVVIDANLKVKCDQYTELPYQFGSLHDLTEENYSNTEITRLSPKRRNKLLFKPLHFWISLL